MLPATQKRKPRNSSKVNLFLSLIFHSLIVLAVFFFAAHEGFLGERMRTLTVVMDPKKPEPKDPVKPKEVEPPKPEPPKLADLVKPPEPPKFTQAPPPATAMTAPPAIAPPVADAASFDFSGGVVVESSSDPVEIYKGQLEYSLRSGWNRPEDLDDQSLVAEVEVAVDAKGQIAADPVWKKSSGQKRWDDSVRQALAKTRSMSRPPPANFPSRFVVRFDVVATEPVGP